MDEVFEEFLSGFGWGEEGAVVVWRDAVGFFLGLSLLLELAEFFLGSGHHAVEAVFDGDEAFVGGGFGFELLGAGGLDEGGGDDGAGGEGGGEVVIGILLGLVLVFEVGFEVGGLGFVEVIIGFLDAFETPGDGDDAVGEMELGEVLGLRRWR